MKHIYEIEVSGELFSSRIKAHNRLSEIAAKPADKFLPIREKLLPNKKWILIDYPNFHRIICKHLK